MKRGGIGVGITGLGVHLPSHVRTNAFWPQSWIDNHPIFAKRDLVHSVDEAVRTRRQDVDPEVARATQRFASDPFRGSQERRVIAEHHESSDMEALAGQSALAHAGLAAEDIDLLAVYSQVPDYPSPANQGAVAAKIGLPLASAACTLDVGCASFLPQIVLASRMIQTGEATNALVIVSSALSRITDFEAPSSANGGDGAVAAVIQRVEDGFGYIAQAQLTRGDLHRGICLIQKQHPTGRWYDGAPPGPLTAQSLDPAATHMISAHAASLAKDATDAVLAKAGYAIEDVDFFLCAHATSWFAPALAEAIGIDPGRRLDVSEHYQRFGHLVPASVALNMALSHRQGRLRRGDLVLIYSPGAGFTQAAMLIRWSLD